MKGHLNFGWDMGDEVTIMIGNVAHTVEISGVTKGEISRTMYFHRAELSDLTGVQSTRFLFRFLMEPSLEGLSDVTIGYSLKEDAVKTFETPPRAAATVCSVDTPLGIVIAIAVLFNTLLMNLAERDTELATLRVLGAPMSKSAK